MHQTATFRSVSRTGQAFITGMNQKHIDSLAASQRIDLYCKSYPRSPAAVRQPNVFERGGVWIALLGPSIQGGIAGFGLTVEAALRSFDMQYRNFLRPSSDAVMLDNAA
jgi:hypothetical protein